MKQVKIQIPSLVENIRVVESFIDNSKDTFHIEDEGAGFNFENLDDPTAPENLENPGGRGIFLIRHLADEVEFSKEGRRVQLTFQLTPTPADENAAADHVAA